MRVEKRMKEECPSKEKWPLIMVGNVVVAAKQSLISCRYTIVDWMVRSIEIKNDLILPLLV
jgi:hypothetical protein